MKPKITIKQLEKKDPMTFKVLFDLAKQFAIGMYREDKRLRSEGVEKLAETILSMVEEGKIQIIHNEDEDRFYLQAVDN